MRSCQLCGCSSWGPIKDATVREGILARPILRGPEPAVMRDPNIVLLECDGCGSFADEALISEPVPTLTRLSDIPFGLTAPPSIDYGEAARSAQVMLQNMGIQPKTPETRTERLVRSMLESGMAHNPLSAPARTLVAYAREIEVELDTPASDGSDG